MGRPTFSLVALFLVGLAAATSAQGIFVTPARIEAVVSGDGALPALYVQNRTSEPLRFWAEAGWASHDIYGNPIYLPQEWRSDVAVHIDPESALLAPGEGVHVRIHVHPTDRPSYPVVYLAFQRVEEGRIDVLRVAVPVLLHTGRERARVFVEGVSVQSNGGESELHLLIANHGAAHIRVGGRLHLIGRNDELVAVSDVPEALVLPGARRLLSAVWEGGPLPWGEYRIVFVEGGLGAEELSSLRIVLGPDGPRYMPNEAVTQIAQSEPIP